MQERGSDAAGKVKPSGAVCCTDGRTCGTQAEARPTLSFVVKRAQPLFPFLSVPLKTKKKGTNFSLNQRVSSKAKVPQNLMLPCENPEKGLRPLVTSGAHSGDPLTFGYFCWGTQNSPVLFYYGCS